MCFLKPVGSILFGVGVYTFAAKMAGSLPAGFRSGADHCVSCRAAHWYHDPGRISPSSCVPSGFWHMFPFLKSLRTMIISTIIISTASCLIFLFMTTGFWRRCSAAIPMGAGLAIIYMRTPPPAAPTFYFHAAKRKAPHFSLRQISMIMDAVIYLSGGPPAFGDIRLGAVRYYLGVCAYHCDG